MISKFINSVLYFAFLVWTLGVAFEVIDPPTYRDLTVVALGAFTIGLGNSSDIRRLKEGVAGATVAFTDALKRAQKP